MTLVERCVALGKLGDYILDPQFQNEIDDLLSLVQRENGWFRPEQSKIALKNIAKFYLNTEKLYDWAKNYKLIEDASIRCGLVMAGNIPAVGFHDLICVFISGQKSLIKYSDKDKTIIPFLLRKLADLSPATVSYFENVERLVDADKVIATGSDNSARYFEYYFSKKPNLIRSNRNSVAVLTGKETSEDLKALGEDIFRFYGLGCRSVSKIYVPNDFNFEYFMEQMDCFSDDLLVNSKYKNNYDYNRSIFLLNQTKHWCNDSLILLEDVALQSRIATLNYEFYQDLEDVYTKLKENLNKIQCIVSQESFNDVKTITFGKSQNPFLSDYADGIDTMIFLNS